VTLARLLSMPGESGYPALRYIDGRTEPLRLPRDLSGAAPALDWIVTAVVLTALAAWVMA
jgi:hypothetical protein